MRFYFILILTLFSQTIFSQNEAATDNSKIYSVVDEMPRFPGCEVGIMTLQERNKCAEENMLRYMYANITYPDSARAKGTEGRVVLQFVVSKNGQVNDAKVVKDIGDGCGEEALRVVNLMQEQNIYWKPGMKDSLAVDVKFTLPIKFKIQEYTPPPPYTIYNGDTIYTQVQKPVEFEGGLDALNIFLATETGYPESGLDSCLIGAMTANVLVRKDGSVQLLETTDYSNLGTDFLFEIIKLVPKSENKWKPATFDDQPVTSFHPLRVEFRPTSAGCKSIVDDYESLSQIANEGVDLHDAGKSEEGILKITQAIDAFPKNTEWLYFRAIMNLGLNNNELACEDFGRIRTIVVVPWYEKWLDMICGF